MSCAVVCGSILFARSDQSGRRLNTVDELSDKSWNAAFAMVTTRRAAAKAASEASASVLLTPFKKVRVFSIAHAARSF